MPTLNIDQFPHAPHEGDKIKVLGKVKSINEDTGEVEVSYDDVSFVKKGKSKDNSSEDNSSDNTDNLNGMDQQTMPETQTLDSALNQAFNRTQ